MTEEKCAVLFSATVNLGPNNATFLLQVRRLPGVIWIAGSGVTALIVPYDFVHGRVQADSSEAHYM